ncbi:hypothetical protein GCM10012285_59650 [Streptomyces kronopolitis]|uniref:Uncharacterized protein n=1 Tax=Streptomyces kronopolitis TaxID=1612435 RepID=A0ABQ2K1E9_9ACTN|nr:hypothetical protein GCM10012285_59650 [Streptomyces kronopolitis]
MAGAGEPGAVGLGAAGLGAAGEVTEVDVAGEEAEVGVVSEEEVVGEVGVLGEVLLCVPFRVGVVLVMPVLQASVASAASVVASGRSVA